MRKLFLPILAGALLTACIDKDYDLENVDTDNIAIGGDDSKFEVPLARVLVTLEDIANGDLNILELCEKADKWLPSKLPGNADFVDLVLLSRNSYTDELFDALVAEMQSSAAKLDVMTDMMWTDYRHKIAGALGIPAEDQYETQFKEAFRTAVRNTEQRVLNEVKSQFSGYLTEDLSVEPIDYNIGRVDISDDVIDMIADNLDPEGSGSSRNSLYLAGEIVSRLPVSLYLEPEFKTAAAPFLKFDVTVDATKEENAIPSTQLYADDLRQIVDGATIRIPIALEIYYPGKGFETDKPQIEIKLHLIKHGGLKLDI